MSRTYWSFLIAVAIGLVVAATAITCTSTEEPTDDQQNQVSDEDATDDADDPADDADTDDGDADTRPDDTPDCEASVDNQPEGLLLTWQSDPTTTMTVDWHSIDTQDFDDADEDDPHPRTTLCLRKAGTDWWTEELRAEQHEAPHLERTIHRIEVTDLEPDTEYVFQTGEFDREYRFRTMPEDIDDRPLKFGAGGDTQHMPDMFEMTNEAVLEYDLDFIVWGGDLAYADGGTDPNHDDRWRWWFEVVRDTLIYEDGRVIPIIATIGNHEVREGYYFEYEDHEEFDEFEPTPQWRTTEAPYYYSFFAFTGQPGYDVLDFGDYLSLIALDSDHTNPVEGEQTGWLSAVLQDRAERDIPHVFPVYHVAAFPSHRDFDGEIPTRIREHWVPEFEKHDLEVVFENHDHTYKRTPPIRDGEVDEEDGITYVGDGAWGVLPRVGASRTEWYIEEFESTLHALIVTLEGDQRHLKTIDDSGEILDQFGDDLD